jgi:hypothetical protein
MSFSAKTASHQPDNHAVPQPHLHLKKDSRKAQRGRTNRSIAATEISQRQVPLNPNSGATSGAISVPAIEKPSAVGVAVRKISAPCPPQGNFSRQYLFQTKRRQETVQRQVRINRALFAQFFFSAGIAPAGWK